MIKNCLICNKDFKTILSLIKKGNGKYCSYQCYWKSRKGKTAWNKGKTNIYTEECKARISNKLKGIKLTEEHKIKISNTMKGVKKSEEAKFNMSKCKKGCISHNKGIPMSEEQKIKLRISHIKRWNLMGRKQNKRPKHGCYEYIDWRNSVFKRDNYICQKCNIKSGSGKTIYLHAHHLKSFAKFPDLRYELNNGITLCINCHKQIHSKYRKEKRNEMSKL